MSAVEEIKARFTYAKAIEHAERLDALERENKLLKEAALRRGKSTFPETIELRAENERLRAELATCAAAVKKGKK